MKELLAKLFGFDAEGLNIADRDIYFDWNNLPPTWIVLFLIAGLVFVCSFIYSREKLIRSGKHRFLLTSFRLLAFIIILMLIFEPTLAVEVIEKKRSSVILLVDNSGSMGMVDVYPENDQVEKIESATGVSELDSVSRLNLVKSALTGGNREVLLELQKKWNLKVYGFSSSVNEIDLDKIGELASTEEVTAIGNSIEDVLKRSRDELVSALVLFSDGQNNEGKDPLTAVIENKQLQVISVIPGLKTPLYDLSIDEVIAPEITYINDEVLARVKTTSKGYSTGNATISVYKRRLVDRSSDIRVEPDEMEKLISESEYVTQVMAGINEMSSSVTKSIPMEFTEEGRYLIIFKVTKNKGEVTYVNNYYVSTINVVDDLIKILLVDYRPRLEYLYLKSALQRDKSALFHSLLVDADYDFPQECSDPRIFDESVIKKHESFFRPLSEFPKSLSGLLEYDVIILGDVGVSDLGFGSEEEIMGNFIRFVDEFGGGLVFLAGSRGSPEFFYGTLIEPLLPIVPNDIGESSVINSADVSFKVTDEGLNSPILRFAPEDDRNKMIWEEEAPLEHIRPVRWMKQVKRVKPASVALLYAKDGISDEEIPLVVWQHYGRGRTIYVGSDDLWYSLRYFKGDAPYYYTFWRQMFQWVREGRLKGSKRFYILLDNKTGKYRFGDKVVMEIRAYDTNYLPVKDEAFSIDIETPGRGVKNMDLLRKKDGLFQGEYQPEEPGSYRILITQENMEQISEVFDVIYVSKEKLNPLLHIRRLQEISDSSSDGKMIDITQLNELPKLLKESKLSQVLRVEEDIWDSPIFFIIFLALIAGEWILRKRLNMV